MKKYSVLIAVAMLALGLTACGDNKTKQKVVGVEVVDSNGGGSVSAAATPTVAQSQTYSNSQTAISDASSQISTILASVMATGNPSAPTAPTGFGSPARFAMNARYAQDKEDRTSIAFSSDSVTGWYSYTYSSDAYWNYTMRFHLTDNAGKTITPQISAGRWYGEGEGEGSTLAIKKYEFEYSGFWDADAYRTANSVTSAEANPLKRCTYTGTYSMDYTTPGDYKGGVTTNGSYKTIMTYKDGAQQTYTTILSNLSFSFSGTRFQYTGGSYSMSYYDWQYMISFNADGSGSGYCKGPGYNYRITVSASTGEWSYVAQ